MEKENENSTVGTGSGTFRVSVSLARYFSDERALCYMAADAARSVRWLARRVRRTFALPERVALCCRGHLLPPAEPLALLRPDDAIEVIPANSRVVDITREPTPRPTPTPEVDRPSVPAKRRRRAETCNSPTAPAAAPAPAPAAADLLQEVKWRALSLVALHEEQALSVQSAADEPDGDLRGSEILSRSASPAPPPPRSRRRRVRRRRAQPEPERAAWQDGAEPAPEPERELRQDGAEPERELRQDGAEPERELRQDGAEPERELRQDGAEPERQDGAEPEQKLRQDGAEPEWELRQDGAELRRDASAVIRNEGGARAPRRVRAWPPQVDDPPSRNILGSASPPGAVA